MIRLKKKVIVKTTVPIINFEKEKEIVFLQPSVITVQVILICRMASRNWDQVYLKVNQYFVKITGKIRKKMVFWLSSTKIVKLLVVHQKWLYNALVKNNWPDLKII